MRARPSRFPCRRRRDNRGGGSPPAPANFRLGDTPTYYEIETNAVFTGPITICVDYSSVSYGSESLLALLHYDEQSATWQDVTSSVDTVTKIICGSTTSLSPFLVAETNKAPVVSAITLPVAPIPLGESSMVVASFIDANPRDVHTAVIAWDDGEAPSPGTVSGAAGTGTVSGGRSFASAGVYTIAVTVSDGEKSGQRQSTLDAPAYVVVYDPSAGFVTGGGWIDSPAGACSWSGCGPTGAATGKATFGFVSRYKKGASIPTGNTEFQFIAGDLRFSSISYHWLVVAGNKAQYKGEGAINGGGGYGFLLTAIDGDKNNRSPDKFRIKVWNSSTGWWCMTTGGAPARTRPSRRNLVEAAS